MAKIRLPIGYPDFRRIREDGCYYVDKSHVISSLIESLPCSVVFRVLDVLARQQC